MKYKIQIDYSLKWYHLLINTIMHLFVLISSDNQFISVSKWLSSCKNIFSFLPWIIVNISWSRDIGCSFPVKLELRGYLACNFITWLGQLNYNCAGWVLVTLQGRGSPGLGNTPFPVWKQHPPKKALRVTTRYFVNMEILFIGHCIYNIMFPGDKVDWSIHAACILLSFISDDIFKILSTFYHFI